MVRCSRHVPRRVRPQAIVFGDREDPESAVSKLSESPRAEGPLEELGTGPRVVYLKEGGWGDGVRP